MYWGKFKVSWIDLQYN